MNNFEEGNRKAMREELERDMAANHQEVYDEWARDLNAQEAHVPMDFTFAKIVIGILVFAVVGMWALVIISNAVR
jgi:hypothetical protein